MTLNSCAACGKADVSLKACSSCKLVKYCNVKCQRAHRSKHKQDCKKRADELFDKKLFAEPPLREDCPICMIMLPCDEADAVYMSCCGKTICLGCRYSLTAERCPFCNAAPPTSEKDWTNRVLKRIEKHNDPMAMYILGGSYSVGSYGNPMDLSKAAEMYRRGSELGCAAAHNGLGRSYTFGIGVELNEKKAVDHYHIAAMMGLENAMYNLGCCEVQSGNMHRAMGHFMMAAKRGHDLSLDNVKRGFRSGSVTKDEFEKTLRRHQASLDETKNEQRDRGKAIYNSIP